MMFELKRGSMKEKWGLSIAFRFLDYANTITLPNYVFSAEKVLVVVLS